MFCKSSSVPHLVNLLALCSLHPIFSPSSALSQGYHCSTEKTLSMIRFSYLVVIKVSILRGTALVTPTATGKYMWPLLALVSP